MLNVLWTFGPWFALGVVVYCFMVRFGYTWRYWGATEQLRISMRQAAKVRRTWPELSQNLGLVLRDASVSTRGFGSYSEAKEAAVVIPPIATRADEYGVIAQVKTVAGVGLTEVKKAAPYLSDAWGMTRVAVTRPKPGRVQIRAVRTDPLAVPLQYVPRTNPPEDLSRVHVGVDEFGEPVHLRVANVAGTGVYGLPGYGKTSFILGLICELAPSSAVQFVALDGKVTSGAQGDYADLAPRFAALIGDNVEEANELLRQLCEFRAWRSSNIRDYLGGGKNIWTQGPTPEWPLVVVVIDECHTYFEQVKDGGDKKLRASNALAAQNTRYVQELVKKGRSVGIWVIPATQKGTGDAIPTHIRDVCSGAISFACKTDEAAIAALGADIRNHPDANPVGLQDPSYVGVASMVVEGRTGFTRFRNPYCSELEAAQVAQTSAHLLSSGASAVKTLTVGTEHHLLSAGTDRLRLSDDQ